MKVCCVFSLESSHRGDSNEYKQYIIININKKIALIYPPQLWDFSWEFNIEFEIAVVNEPSVSEPLKFYCISYREFEG